MAIRNPLLLLLLLLVLGSPPAQAGTAVVSMHAVGGDMFEVRGEGLVKVGGMDISVGYDAAYLMNPRVTGKDLVAGALMVTNTNIPGTVRIAVVPAGRAGISGGGVIATLTFDKSGASGGKAVTLSARLVDLKGGLVAVNIVNRTTADQPAAESASSPASTTGASPVWLGGVTMPENGPSPKERESEKAGQESAPKEPVQEPVEKMASKETTADNEMDDREGKLAGADAKPAEPKLVSHKGVLDRFREFAGEKNPRSLMALFENYSVKGFRQEPPVLLSDGRSSGELIVGPELIGKETPNFALVGAKLVNFKRGEDGMCRLEIMPDTNAYEASVKVLLGSAVIDIPLTVAPPVGVKARGVVPTEADFALFLRGEGKQKKGQQEDKAARSHIDEYIFTANYLVQLTKKKTAR